jgi:hypothetical protein
MAASRRNPLHLLAGSNDYAPSICRVFRPTRENGDAWLAV